MSTTTRVPFPNQTQLRRYLPVPIWQLLRFISIGTAGYLVYLLWTQPDLGLLIFWSLAVPALPLTFFVIPGLWRNLCPLASTNQLPRLFRFTLGLTAPKRVRESVFLAGVVLFLAFVLGRKFLFNHNGHATAILIAGALSGAFLGGVLFKGKSGWCSSICPLLPIQRLYGQTPYVTVANTHCRPCLGCAKNCYDFNPGVAYLADQYDDDRHYSGVRRLFAALFPGFVLAFYMVPSYPQAPASEILFQTGLFMAVSVALFQTLDTLLKLSLNALITVYAAAALNIYYWFAAPSMAAAIASLGLAPPHGAAWGIRLGVALVSGAWIARGLAREKLFLQQLEGRATVSSARIGDAADRALAATAAERAAELRVEPEGPAIAAQSGQSVLDILEDAGLKIESGCRMGVCGADPIAVTCGAEHLEPIGDEERATLERLGLADNTRMACCARINGPVTVELTPHKSGAAATPAVTDFDRDIKSVVVVGMGIAGITAADHLRRNHPECEIHVVGRESHLLYNRMGISRLIYGRSGMQGLYLLPEDWYEEHRVTPWLNTLAVGLDPDERRVELATGEVLPYDRLILAMGSSGVEPNLEGFGMPGSFVVRDANHAIAIREYVQSRRVDTAVVIGAGLLGLEAAYALHKLGLKVSVLCSGGWVLNRQLDAEAGAMLAGYLRGLGIDVLTEAAASKLTADGRGGVAHVELKDGRSVPCQLVLAAVGVRPDVELAKAAGIPVNRGILVDSHMETQHEHIYAAGDVAEFQGMCWGLWPVAVEQGEIAALAALGRPRDYAGAVPTTMLKVAGADVVSVGHIEPQDENDEVIRESDPANYRYAKLVVSKGQLTGAILIGYAAATAAAVTRSVKNGDPAEVAVRALKAP